MKVKEALSVMPMDREFQNKMKDVEVEIWKSLEKTGCSVTSLLETYLRVSQIIKLTIERKDMIKIGVFCKKMYNFEAN